jgi:hypothetical protein
MPEDKEVVIIVNLIIHRHRTFSQCEGGSPNPRRNTTRSFLRWRIFALLVVAGLSTSGAAGSDRPLLPTTTVPPFTGIRYQAQAPATLDLAEQMRLSLHGITHCVGGPPQNPFPRTQYLCNHIISVRSYPPEVARNVCLYGKYVLGALLARIVTGSEEDLHVDSDWRTGLLDFERINPVMNGPEGGRWLEWIAFNIRREPEPNRSAWVALAKRAVAQLNKAAVPYKDGVWIAYGQSPPDDGFKSVRDADTIPSWIPLLKIHPPTGVQASADTWGVPGLWAV